MNGQPFYWSSGEPLTEIEKPERTEEIKRKWDKTQQKVNSSVSSKLLLHILGQTDNDVDTEERGLSHLQHIEALFDVLHGDYTLARLARY